MSAILLGGDTIPRTADDSEKIRDRLPAHKDIESVGWKLTDTADKITAIADKIPELEPSIASARTVAMGLEGHAAAIYWHQVLSFVPEAMGFKGRITRFAKDVFKQCLNYVYGILYGEVWQAIVKVGLDPYFGLMHGSQRDQGEPRF